MSLQSPQQFDCLVCSSRCNTKNQTSINSTKQAINFKIQDEISDLPFSLSSSNYNNNICNRCEELLRNRQSYRIKVQEIDLKLFNLSHGVQQVNNESINIEDDKKVAGITCTSKEAENVSLNNDSKFSINLPDSTNQSSKVKFFISKRKFDEIDTTKENDDDDDDDDMVHSIPEKKQIRIINCVVGGPSQVTSAASSQIPSIGLRSQSIKKQLPKDGNTTTKVPESGCLKCNKSTQTVLKEFPWSSEGGVNTTTAYITVKWPSGLKHKKVSKEMTSIILAMMRGIFNL